MQMQMNNMRKAHVKYLKKPLQYLVDILSSAE